MTTIRQWLPKTSKKATISRRSDPEVTIQSPSSREELFKILNPVHLVTAFIGYKSKHHPYLSYIGLPLWVFNLAVHFALDFYEAAHVFGWAWATAMAVFFFSFVTGTYSIIKSTIPWLEDALEVLHVEGNFAETLHKMHKIAKKLPWLLPIGAVAAGCGQYVCFFIDDATQLELSQRWLSIVLNVARVVSLLHVLYGFITFLAILLFILYLTGASMKEFRDAVEGEFKEKEVRLTFREAVQLFEHRSHFIQRSSDACLFLMVNFVITTVLSFVVNGYNFLFLQRYAVYLWFALVPMLWSVLPLSMAAWATDTYQGYVTSVVKSWGEHPQSDESESEGEDMNEYHETLKKIQQSNCKGRSSLIASTSLLSSIKKKRLVLKKDRRMTAAALAAKKRWDDIRSSTQKTRFASSADAILSLSDIKNSEINPALSASSRPTILKNSSGVLAHKPKKSKFNFKTYVLYLEGVIHEVGFSIGGVVLSWDKVSSLGLLWFSLIAVFIQEVLFGSRKSTINE